MKFSENKGGGWRPFGIFGGVTRPYVWRCNCPKRMHLVSYEFGLIKVLPEGDVGVNVSHHPKQDYLRKGRRRVRKKEERDKKNFPERKRKAKRTEEENFAVVKVLIWNTFANFCCDKANPRCDYTCICGPSNWLLAEASDSLSSANWHWAISKWKRATDDATYLQHKIARIANVVILLWILWLAPSPSLPFFPLVCE